MYCGFAKLAFTCYPVTTGETVHTWKPSPGPESPIDIPHQTANPALERETDDTPPEDKIEDLEQKMKNVSQQVAEDDHNLNKIAKRVKASDQKIAKYDERREADDD